jgi:hypothetical protein
MNDRVRFGDDMARKRGAQPSFQSLSKADKKRKGQTGVVWPFVFELSVSA